jgi:hypothetical protein
MYSRYQSMNSRFSIKRRDFVKTSGLAGAGLLLGVPSLFSQDKEKAAPPPKPKTNIEDALKIPRTANSIPGAFPGRVVEVCDEGAMPDGKPQPRVIEAMFTRGLEKLTGKSAAESWGLFFNKDDVVGIKVNPVGAGLISTRLELVDAIIAWLVAGGLKKDNIIIWDRFDVMLTEAGFTSERYPGIGIEGLQTMVESENEQEADSTLWMDKDGNHKSVGNFDKNVFYWADVDAPQDSQYRHQHVFADKYSYFGKLVTQKLTKIINVPVFKNTGNGISIATKNLGYGVICNTGRLHKPLFFDVCTEVLAFPAVRDKLVLNVTDGLRAQYDGGPGPDAGFTWFFDTILLATDPFALDTICHGIMVEKRKSMKIQVNEHPMFSEYLRYGERLGLGVADKGKIEHLVA